MRVGWGGVGGRWKCERFNTHGRSQSQNLGGGGGGGGGLINNHDLEYYT